jgi:hypothetical protein
MGLPVLCLVCVAAALAVVPAGASAASVSSSCSKQVLLLPGMTTSCSTGIVTCPAGHCFVSGKAVAGAAVGVTVGGTVVSTAKQKITQGTTVLLDSTNPVSATCSSGLAVLNGCTAQTDPNDQVGDAGTFDQSPLPPLVSVITGQGFCQWTGGPIAALATLSCTETITF